MSTSWQWFPETKTAICCYCGFSTTYAEDFRGSIEHDCDPGLHPSITTRQGLHIARSPRPEALSRSAPNHLLPCIHRGIELRQEPCETCGGIRIKVFGCDVHRECQLDDRLAGVQSCGDCAERTLTSIG